MGWNLYHAKDKALLGAVELTSTPFSALRAVTREKCVMGDYYLCIRVARFI